VALRTKPTAGTRTANQALSLLHALYKWAIESARTYVGDNPAHGIQKFPEIERERFLTKGELPPFFKTLQTHASAPMRCFFFAALMTGARRANVLSMRWDDLDLAAATWRLPETKNGKPQTVTLAPELVDMLTELKANPHRWVKSDSLGMPLAAAASGRRVVRRRSRRCTPRPAVASARGPRPNRRRCQACRSNPPLRPAPPDG